MSPAPRSSPGADERRAPPRDRSRRRIALGRLALALLATVLAGAGCTRSAAAGPSATSPAGADAYLEREVLRLVDRHRSARGLPALASDARIAREARRHSAAMASGSRPFGHDGFADRMAALQRIMACPSGAENVSSTLGYDEPAPQVVREWLSSRGHRGSIEGPWARTGVGVARTAAGKLYFTQIFCAPPS